MAKTTGEKLKELLIFTLHLQEEIYRLISLRALAHWQAEHIDELHEKYCK